METKHISGGTQNPIRARAAYVDGYMVGVHMSYEADYQIVDNNVFTEKVKAKMGQDYEFDDAIFLVVTSDMNMALSGYAGELLSDATVNPLEIQEKYNHEKFLELINIEAASNGYKIIDYTPIFSLTESDEEAVKELIARKHTEENKSEETTVDTDTVKATNSDSFNPLPFIIIGVAVLIIAIIVTVIMLKGKKKKQNLPPQSSQTPNIPTPGQQTPNYPPQTPTDINYPPQNPNLPPTA